MRLRRIATAFVAALACAGGLLTTTASAQAAPPGPAADAAQPLIIGGEPATEDYPFYTKLIMSDGRFACGGSLIAPQWVVTAAHCLSHTSSVRIGGTTLGSGEQRTVVQRISGPNGSDIALLKLGSASTRAPIAITGSALAAGDPVRIMGHGQTCPTRGCGSAPNQLMQLDTTLLSGGCSYQPSSELCVGESSGAGACYGDSGGPLVVRVDNRWELGGATSRGEIVCATGPSVYMKVPAFKSWIEGHTGDLDGGGTNPDCAKENFTGSLNPGGSAYQPESGSYQTTASGVHRGCLAGPSGADYDLYLEKWNGSTWDAVKSGTTPQANEEVEYNGTAGTYRWRVLAYSGSGSYTLKTDKP